MQNEGRTRLAARHQASHSSAKARTPCEQIADGDFHRADTASLAAQSAKDGAAHVVRH